MAASIDTEAGLTAAIDRHKRNALVIYIAFFALAGLAIFTGVTTGRKIAPPEYRPLPAGSSIAAIDKSRDNKDIVLEVKMDSFYHILYSADSGNHFSTVADSIKIDSTNNNGWYGLRYLSDNETVLVWANSLTGDSSSPQFRSYHFLCRIGEPKWRSFIIDSFISTLFWFKDDSDFFNYGKGDYRYKLQPGSQYSKSPVSDVSPNYLPPKYVQELNYPANWQTPNGARLKPDHTKTKPESKLFTWVSANYNHTKVIAVNGDSIYIGRDFNTLAPFMHIDTTITDAFNNPVHFSCKNDLNIITSDSGFTIFILGSSANDGVLTMEEINTSTGIRGYQTFYGVDGDVSIYSMDNDIAVLGSPGTGVIYYFSLKGGLDRKDMIPFADSIVSFAYSGNQSGYGLIYNNSLKSNFLVRSNGEYWTPMPVFYTTRPINAHWSPIFTVEITAGVALLLIIVILLIINGVLKKHINEHMTRKPDILSLISEQPL